jgi:hypothetical protein
MKKQNLIRKWHEQQNPDCKIDQKESRRED